VYAGSTQRTFGEIRITVKGKRKTAEGFKEWIIWAVEMCSKDYMKFCVLA